ncbi:acetylornithine deacetylase [Haloferax prahovense DSM 18310]|uniref:Acetylornithine deacetylase n=1 Tax=Haloferax prahovense (strain DSM 18310 / JCM 13924 / TL6) TaxID=1227461 RepID=M0FTL5_HALPT|nr:MULTISPECIES: M20 family metallopeptidase [Haloferax]ELZ63386.1 acetylornithine deacetylase [Haloferax prahovense DSM 18310]RDZ39759.1 acetylornithine deacetylase [Haloferax sp. Atlit-19N]
MDEELLSLLTSLVEIETENPPGDEGAAAAFVYDWLESRGVSATLVEEPYPDRPQVVARVGDGEPSVVLNGHLDVVPAGDRDQWDLPPYEPTVRDGRLYGRGSADMKCGVALAMLATVEFADALDSGSLDGSLVFHAAVGEETAEPGTKTLLERGYDGTYGVVLEPTSLRTATSAKGLGWYEITVGGDPSHASRPDEGDNAIGNARLVLDALAAYDERIRQRSDPLVGRPTATVTQFEAGTKENVVPEGATITVDRRFVPSESVEEVDAEIDAVLSDVAAEHDLHVEWARTRVYESAAVPTDSDIATRFRDAAAERADTDPEPWGIRAATDVRNLVNDAGMDAITWGPGSMAQAHAYDEYIELSEVEAGYDILCTALRGLFEDVEN